MKLKREQEMARKQQQLEYIGSPPSSISQSQIPCQWLLTHKNLGKRLRDIREWLSPGDPRTNYEAAHALQQAGTGKWFIEGSQFAEWFQKNNTFLWIHGARK